MTRALLALDVDGPLNPWAAGPLDLNGYTNHRMCPAAWWGPPLKVRLHPDHGPMLVDFAENHSLDMVWATTWMDDANVLIGPAIGLPELPVINFGKHPGALAEWKYPAVAEYAAGRPLVWLDDDFHTETYLDALAEFEKSRLEVPTLLKHVDPAVGLTVDDLGMVGAWLDAAL